MSLLLHCSSPGLAQRNVASRTIVDHRFAATRDERRQAAEQTTVTDFRHLFDPNCCTHYNVNCLILTAKHREHLILQSRPNATLAARASHLHGTAAHHLHGTGVGACITVAASAHALGATIGRPLPPTLGANLLANGHRTTAQRIRIVRPSTFGVHLVHKSDHIVAEIVYVFVYIIY